MDQAAPHGDALSLQKIKRVAEGRPDGAGAGIYFDLSETLLDNGYVPLPIRVGQKRPAVSRWSSVPVDEQTVSTWKAQHRGAGVGLRTGALVGLDIDCLDPDAAHRAHKLAESRFGSALVRVGQWPKRLLCYRTDRPFSKLKVGKIEFLGAGQQFVAFGIHPGTHAPYYWATGETPCDVALCDLPPIELEDAQAFLAEVADEAPKPSPRQRINSSVSNSGNGPLRNADGKCCDGRDNWLSSIAYHSYWDAIDACEAPDIGQLTDRTWSRFQATTDLSRARKNGSRLYSEADARAKVLDKIRLGSNNLLPPRDVDVPDPEYSPPGLCVDEGRRRLQQHLLDYCTKVVFWHEGDALAPPALGIKATVGLGKSASSRAALTRLLGDLRDRGLPDRLLVFTASHALAEETATGWQDAGFQAAVLRGYERTDPVSGKPMCQDLEMVQTAFKLGVPVHGSVCSSPGGAQCRFYATCLKQSNRAEVAAAQVVVAPYDALFSSLAFDVDDIAMILVDEGCWARAVDRKIRLTIQDLSEEPISDMGQVRALGRGPVGAMADLLTFRAKANEALVSNGEGGLRKATLEAAGLSRTDCIAASKLEAWRQANVDLTPGLDQKRRETAFRDAANNSRIKRCVALWESLADVLDGPDTPSGRVYICKSNSVGGQVVELRQLKPLHPSLRGKPILHLDATLRSKLARTVLPLTEISSIEVAAPNMELRLVHGSFGKSMICPGNLVSDEESRRRANRLLECVDYVRWHAARHVNGRVLVVTYQAIEHAFQGIPNVETAHFNAIAGLDRYKDVATLISIGRPLPPSTELDAMVGASFGSVVSGGYKSMRIGIHMRKGQPRSLKVLRHEHDAAETLRAAICDDELVQVIGRGRGVNRSPQNPLEVHVLADVALPLVHDRLIAWETVCPDVFQQMLLAGVAVDSPSDAADLHPNLFGNVEQAKKAIERSGFKGQNPITTSYREMSLKSAAYRKPGRGRGWQHAWWIEGTDTDIFASLENRLGQLAGWSPDKP